MEERRLKVLLVEDDEDDYIITRDFLAEIRGDNFDLDWVENYETGLEAIRKDQHAVYLVDYRLGKDNGLPWRIPGDMKFFQSLTSGTTGGGKNAIVVGRKTWGGSDSEELSRALHEIHYAFVTTHFKASDARLIEHSFNVFPQIWIERREFASDPIEACTVTLADPIVSSLQDEHLIRRSVCVNDYIIVKS